MSDPKEIYLAPKCCPDPEFGRCWATDDEWPLAPGDEDNGHYPATRYVRADIHEAALKRQAGAARTLQASTLETVRHLHEKDRSEYTAGATLESEREANARLTEEIERLRTLNAEMREALRLHVAYEALPADRGGDQGPKGQAWRRFIEARDAALEAADG